VVSEVYAPEFESGIRYDDPALAIEWPIQPSVVSDKDLDWKAVKDRIGEFDFGFRVR